MRILPPCHGGNGALPVVPKAIFRTQGAQTVQFAIVASRTLAWGVVWNAFTQILSLGQSRANFALKG